MQPTPEQIQYVTNERARGVSDADLRVTLLQNGYTEELVGQLLVAAPTSATPGAAPVASEPVKKKTSVLKIILIIFGVLVAMFILLGVVVMSELNNARDKGRDAAMMNQLNNFRATAEIYYDANSGSYLGACDELTVENADCRDSATAYRVSTELITGEFFCVDSAGHANRLVIKPIGLSCDL